MRPTAILLAAAAAVAFKHPVQSAPMPLRGRLQAYNHPAIEEPDAADRTSAPAGGIRVSPLTYGADPLGVADSSAAFAACVAACVNYSIALDPLGHFPGDASFGNGRYIANAGGCEIDLGGGEYKLSAPVIIPEYLGNLRLGHGSLIADDAPGVFPAGGFLVVVGVEGSCKVPQGSCNLDLGFPELFLDGRHVASGLQINNVMGTTVGPGAYFLNFSAYGLQINGGHEVLMDRCWLGETNFDYPFSPTDLPQATAIQINGNDHYILNTIVFSSKVGLEVHGAANYVSGVHVWFPINRALAFVDAGVMAFHVTEGQNRFMGCYVDGGRAVFEGGGLSGNVWTHGFECCAGGGLDGVPHGIELLGDAVGPGLEITHSIFRGGNVFSTPITNGTTVRVTGVRVEGNSFTGGGGGTRATLTLTQAAATQWQFDFCSLLVFPSIQRVSVSVVAAAGFPVAQARPPVGCTVLVETSTPVTGDVTVTVDSSALSADFV